jgi:anti-sigma regulatory factor (Ser/Thr protein kinase)
MVTDWGPGFDARTRTREPGDHTGGWGLFLVERLADNWGVQRDGESTMVWFELRIHANDRSAVGPAAGPLLHALSVS